MKVSFIGSGNVATHLADAISKMAGISIHQVISRKMENAKQLSIKVGALPSDQLSHLIPNYDLLILAVNDDALEEVISKLPVFEGGIICHTAGSASSDIFCSRWDKYGVIYPLQTFTKGKPIQWSEVPILISASDEQTEYELVQLTQNISARVQTTSDVQRAILHLAAVFACNFTNAMMSISEDLCQSHYVDFPLIHPLIIETFEKALSHGPKKSQTGPATRNDVNTIKKHLHLLSERGLEKAIYKLVSEYILEKQSVNIDTHQSK